MKATLFSVFPYLSLAAVFAGGQSTYVRTQDRDWKIAQRLNDDRMVVILTSDDAALSDAERRSVIGPEFSKPSARYIDRLWRASDEWVRRSTGSTLKRKDALVIDGGRAGWFDARVDDFVFGAVGCGGGGGILAGVVPERREAFSHLKEKYFPVRGAAGWTQPTAASLVGPATFTLRVAQRRAIERLLQQEFVRTSTPLLDEADAHTHKPVMLPWRKIYKRLAAGEGRLLFDAQAFRVTPDGAPRLFVRASWTLDHQQVYMMGAWIQTAPEFSIEASDIHAARYAWYTNMFDSLDLFWNGRVLNISDVDRDGTAEILMLFEGYESVGIQLLAYPPTKDAKVLAAFGAGC